MSPDPPRRSFAARFRRGTSAATSAGSDPEALFDEAFQKRLEYLALVSRRIFAGRMRAERRSHKPGAGIEFAEYRSYYPGDDYRQIDWNVYGRMNRLMFRLKQQEEDLSVYLLIDCSGSMDFGRPRKLDYAKRLTAALAYVALHHLDRVSITAVRDGAVLRLAPTRGRNRIFTVFEFLKPLRAEGGTDLSSSLGAFVAQNKRRGVAILISDLYDPAGFEQGINRLRYGRFETSVIHVRDPNDAEPRLHGDLELVDSETGTLRQVTVTPSLLARYRRNYAAYLERAEGFCRSKRVGWFGVDTRVPADEAMLSILRRGGMLG